MNPRPATPWLRLAAAARRAPARAADESDVLPPAGFATRVVARAKLAPAAGLFGGPTFERLATRALGFACAGALALTVWSSLPTTAGAGTAPDNSAVSDAYLDPVGALLEAVES